MSRACNSKDIYSQLEEVINKLDKIPSLTVKDGGIYNFTVYVLNF